MATGWRCQDDNGICLPLICLQIICIFEFLAVPICSNWPALTSLLKLTKPASADRMRRAAERVGQAGRTATQIVY
jgi:hypothetical protein